MKNGLQIFVYATAGFIICLMLIGFLVPKGARCDIATIQISSNTSWNGTIKVDAQNITVYGSGDNNYRVTGENYQFTESTIVVTVQKQTENGYLRVSITFNGQTKASQTITAAFGVASVAWSL